MSRYRSVALVATALTLLALAASGQESHTGRLALGRAALPEEVAAWAIAIRPDGQGLPEGRGSVRAGEELYMQHCVACHGEFGESAGRWPAIAGGHGSLRNDNPAKTVGSYWPYVSTVFDYLRRAMPFGNAQSLSSDETYAVTAYLLYLNDVVDADFELSRENFSAVALPNAAGFIDDDRETAERHFWGREPCMTECKGEVKVLNRARVLDVTPDDPKAGAKVD